MLIMFSQSGEKRKPRQLKLQTIYFIGGKMKLKGYKKKVKIHDGHGYIYEFDNGFGASVVKHSGSYGGNQRII